MDRVTSSDHRATQVRTARTPSELTACAHTMALAFVDDPLMSSIWPTVSRRRNVLPRYFTATFLYEHSRVGVVDYLADDAGTPIAVAAWDGPERGGAVASTIRTLRAAPRLLSALGARLGAGIRVRTRLDAHEPADQHWTLVNLGVDPSRQGRGYAQLMLEHRLADVDSNSLPAHLVCTRAKNVGLYQRFSFAVSAEFTLADGTPMWSMDRPGPNPDARALKE